MAHTSSPIVNNMLSGDTKYVSAEEAIPSRIARKYAPPLFTDPVPSNLSSDMPNPSSRRDLINELSETAKIKAERDARSGIEEIR